MRRSILGATMAVILATGGYAMLAAGKSGKSCSSVPASSSQCGSQPSAASSGSCGSEPTAAVAGLPNGKIAGRFDPAMSGVCRFACATKLHFQAAEVMAQPGAPAGKLTQCPVSGVVFAVDGSRPRVRLGASEYVTCCDKCAQKLRRNPRHYLKA